MRRTRKLKVILVAAAFSMLLFAVPALADDTDTSIMSESIVSDIQEVGAETTTSISESGTETENKDNKQDEETGTMSGQNTEPGNGQVSPDGAEVPSSTPAESTSGDAVMPEDGINRVEKTAETDQAKNTETLLVEEKAVLDAAREKAREENRTTNSALIGAQNIRRVVPVAEDWRMYRINAKLVYAKTRLSVREDMSDTARIVGQIPKSGSLYILSEEADGWLYIEAGNLRGFIRQHQIRLFARRNRLVREGCYADTANLTQTAPAVFVSPKENRAFAYKRVTAYDPVVTEAGLVLAETADIKEETSEDSRTVGTLIRDDLVYVLLNAGSGYVFVESGEVRGYVKSEDLDCSDKAKERIKSAGEAAFCVADALVSMEENGAWWACIQSIREGSSAAQIRYEMLQYAQQFVGNPYVFGGNDLYNGIDCSAFVQQIYRKFGVTLPRIADAQSRVGTQIPVSDASPGDLLFWAENGYVYHVAMYAGNGETIEAYSSEMGIVHIKRNIETAVWATRLL